MCKVIEIIFLIASFFIVAFGLGYLSILFWMNGLTSTQIVGTIFIGGFFILVGIGGAWASISYMKS